MQIVHSTSITIVLCAMGSLQTTFSTMRVGLLQVRSLSDHAQQLHQQRVKQHAPSPFSIQCAPPRRTHTEMHSKLWTAVLTPHFDSQEMRSIGVQSATGFVGQKRFEMACVQPRPIPVTLKRATSTHTVSGHWWTVVSNMVCVVGLKRVLLVSR